jgi:hypothetical protein
MKIKLRIIKKGLPAPLDRLGGRILAFNDRDNPLFLTNDVSGARGERPAYIIGRVIAPDEYDVVEFDSDAPRVQAFLAQEHEAAVAQTATEQKALAVGMNLLRSARLVNELHTLKLTQELTERNLATEHQQADKLLKDLFSELKISPAAIDALTKSLLNPTNDEEE